MHTDFDTKAGVYYGDMVSEDLVDAVRTAKLEAASLRQMFSGMPAIDRAVAKRTRQFQAIERLVTAVEAL